MKQPTTLEAADVMARLPLPDYSVNFQPTYPDEEALSSVIAELLQITPATTPRNIDKLRDELSTIGNRELHITGSCHENVRLRDSENDVEGLASITLAERAIVLSVHKNALHIHRGAGQSAKPRSSEFEVVGGETVLSFMGEGINGSDVTQRTPNPGRMMAMALQAHDLTSSVRERLGEHVPQAHEMLLLPYEESFVRTDPETGKLYLLSADLPWIGLRTNDPNGPHVKLLSRVENPVGVKIGASSTSEHIKQLSEKLNPHREAGKLIFMLRIGNDVTKTLEILEAIKLYAPNAILMYDLHGVTRNNEQGMKIRCVDEIITQARVLDGLCHAVDLALQGHHLETTVEDRLECVNHANELPKHPGNVDPRLNQQQTRRVLTDSAEPLWHR